MNLTDRIGRKGCTVSYDWGYDYTQPPHSALQRAVDAPEVGYGYLHVDGKKRRFSVLCVRYPNPLYVIHPKDAGWVLKRVQGLMTVPPIWATPSRNIPLTSKVSAYVPDWVSWVDTRWACPQCLPNRNSKGRWDIRYQGNKLVMRCDEDCRITRPSPARIHDYNYDPRVMYPWSETMDPYGGPTKRDCERNLPGPRDPSANVLCIPAIVPNTTGCKSVRVLSDEERYWDAMWASAGAAIREWNRRNPVEETAPPPKAPPAAPEGPALAPPAAAQEGVRGSAWNTPLILSLVAVGIAGTVLYASRS